MNGVTFGSKHSYDDWNLVLTGKSIGLPEPKTSSVAIEGADGVLDTSEVLTGEIKFNNRTLAFEFILQDEYEDFDDKITEIANYLHGQKFKITLDDDPQSYYIGRCSINQWSSDKRIGRIVIYCDCEPYKYDVFDTTVSNQINGDTVVDVLGKRKTVCPIINSTSDMTMTYGGYEYEVHSGDNVFLDVFIYEGYNHFKFKGNGVVKIIFKGGAL